MPSLHRVTLGGELPETGEGQGGGVGQKEGGVGVVVAGGQGGEEQAGRVSGVVPHGWSCS